MKLSEYIQYDGLGLAELIKNQEVTPRECLALAIERLEAYNPSLNAIINKLYDYALDSIDILPKDSLFAGVPILLKDLMTFCKGTVVTQGSRFRKDTAPVDHDSELVKRYKQAGLVIMGKTNAPELGLSPVTEPQLWGPARNPWDLSKTPGGSSGGAAAAVAARIVPIAHGGDGGGSIRIPASCCGLFGLKPTRGRIPSGPDVGRQWQGAVSEHVITRSVRDSAAILDLTHGADLGAPWHLPYPKHSYTHWAQTPPKKLRIALQKEPFFSASIHKDCIAAVEDAAKLCEELGHEVEEVSLKINSDLLSEAFLTIVAGEVTTIIDAWIKEAGRLPTHDELEKTTQLFWHLGKHFNAADFARAIQIFDRVGRQVANFFQNYDVMLTPTLAKPPLTIGALTPSWDQALTIDALNYIPFSPLYDRIIETMKKTSYAFIPYTPLFNVTGQPAASIPLYWNKDNLPIGTQLITRFADEATLFQLAGQLEKARPWSDKIPQLNDNAKQQSKVT